MRAKSVVLLVVLSLAIPAVAATGPEDRGNQATLERLVAQAAQNTKGAAATITLGKGKPEPILSFSWGATNTGSASTGGGGGAGKVVMQDFHFAKPVSASSKTYFEACATGKHYPSVTVDILDEKGTRVAQLTLTDVMVSSYQFGGSSGAPVVDAVSLTYAAVDYYILIGL